MTLYKWSQTASADATADSTINWAEGQSPSSVNDSARGMMAAIAKYRDDTAGAIVTTGTSTAYAVNTYQVFQSFSQLSGQVVAFTPHITNTAGSPNVSLNVDGLGTKTIRADPASELAAGVMVAGTPYVATYNAAQGVFYLHGVFGNPYNVPIGSCIDFFGMTAPNSSFVLAYGQAISRTTYSTLFSLLGTTYGTGDGSTTFNIPDLRGRIIAGKDDMGGSAANRLTSTYFGTSAAIVGAIGGAESLALSLAQLPTGITSVNSSQSISVSSGSTNVTQNAVYISYPNAGGGGTIVLNSGPTNAPLTSTGSNSISVTSNNTSGNAHRTVQPTIIANKLIRIV
ncbi:microcystin-dependent protein [Bradyrhizobium sp. YR681]|uniref:tail fiber protein n=1 Tax=Bradyrhizobium sp. YR681 TaxID=1144344 RepID=UPI0002714116|nr:tail fiber protein [Bradyrhizobium sp. YR681]EJN13417.1 microcystin-dependent protein [Bradyrhizobium sp. YR681]